MTVSRLANRIADPKSKTWAEQRSGNHIALSMELPKGGPQAASIDQYTLQRLTGSHSNRQSSYSADEELWVRKSADIIAGIFISPHAGLLAEDVTPPLTCKDISQRFADSGLSDCSWPQIVCERLAAFAFVYHCTIAASTQAKTSSTPQQAPE